MVEELYDSYKRNPTSISCLHFCIVSFNPQGSLEPYYKWEECHVVSSERIINDKYIFPQGYGGVLYPPHVFDNAVLDIEKASLLAPSADDVWFYCMGLKAGATRSYPYNSRTKYYLIDMFRQLFKKDRLNETNVKVADNNEAQLLKVINHYKIVL